MRSVHLTGKCRTWYVVRPDGSTIMFKRTHYILPKPFREWFYLGKILSNAKVIPNRKKDLDQSHSAKDSSLGNA